MDVCLPGFTEYLVVDVLLVWTAAKPTTAQVRNERLFTWASRLASFVAILENKAIINHIYVMVNGLVPDPIYVFVDLQALGTYM